MSSPAAEAAADALHTDSDAEQSPEGYTVFAVFRKDPARPDDLDGHDVPRFVHELDDMIALVEARASPCAASTTSPACAPTPT